MPTHDVTITTTDGECAASLHVPDGDGPWPGVLLYPDAGGYRPTFRTMGDELASSGFVVLVPDIYYRSGGYEPFDMTTAFSDEDELGRLLALIGDLTSERYLADAETFVTYLQERDDVVDGPVGTTGYCLGGRLSLHVAGHLGERVGAAASFHGGRLAVEGDPDSPHLVATQVRSEVYVGAARDDGSFDAEQAERLAAAYDAASVVATIEEYPALHGFAVPDNPTYDERAAARHRDATRALFERALPR